MTKRRFSELFIDVLLILYMHDLNGTLFKTQHLSVPYNSHLQQQLKDLLLPLQQYLHHYGHTDVMITEF